MKNLVVSLHDVSPLTQYFSDRILAELEELEVPAISLLVIPDHHGKAPLSKHLQFKNWLTRQVNKGHEPVLHGYYHLRAGKPCDSWHTRFVNRVYTAEEGEFYDLSREEASRRLDQGLADLAFLNRPVRGFIAPAWLLGPAAEKAVADRGFLYTTTVLALKILCGNLSVQSRSLVWSTRAPWRTFASLAWNASLRKLVHHSRLVRIGIHPPDIEQAAVWRQIRQIVSTLVRDHQPLTYEQLVKRIASLAS
ncbi:MAG: polysaccharide deacetylase family protein [Verrucomicrobia bacterium]|nr:polysaccharide deacetylase family protein [Verrucomicrobiota bacterium]MBV9672323.1 polysaccharide deacetylase family protein [Verrucomicrobiota bacterium]